MNKTQPNTLDKKKYRWELWVQDNFDWETPRQIEAAGWGLEAGLYLLWQKTLNEGILEDGRPSFLKFNLWIPALNYIVSVGTGREVWPKLQRWVAENEDFLAVVAAYHAGLLEQGLTIDSLLDILKESASWRDCLERFHNC